MGSPIRICPVGGTHLSWNLPDECDQTPASLFYVIYQCQLHLRTFKFQIQLREADENPRCLWKVTNVLYLIVVSH